MWVAQPMLQDVFIFVLQGAKIIQSFMWYLNPRQVFDLSQGGPKEGYSLGICTLHTTIDCTSVVLTFTLSCLLSLELYRKVHNLRILACGGDGTVSP